MVCSFLFASGNLIHMNISDYLNFLYSETIRNQFEAFRVWIGLNLFVFLTKPEDVEVTFIDLTILTW